MGTGLWVLLGVHHVVTGLCVGEQGGKRPAARVVSCSPQDRIIWGTLTCREFHAACFTATDHQLNLRPECPFLPCCSGCTRHAMSCHVGDADDTPDDTRHPQHGTAVPAHKPAPKAATHLNMISASLPSCSAMVALLPAPHSPRCQEQYTVTVVLFFSRKGALGLCFLCARAPTCSSQQPFLLGC
jgi:hypothetical protein